MRIDITNREHSILIDALSMPIGVPKGDRKTADELRMRLMNQVGRQPIPRATTSIRGHWPTNHVAPTPKTNWSYRPRENKVTKAKTNNVPQTAEQILANL